MGHRSPQTEADDIGVGVTGVAEPGVLGEASTLMGGSNLGVLRTGVTGRLYRSRAGAGQFVNITKTRNQRIVKPLKVTENKMKFLDSC